MIQDTSTYLKTKLGEIGYEKLMKIDNQKLHKFIAKYIGICNPQKVNLYNDSEEDIRFTRDAAIRNHEEAKLAMERHTIHFDGYYDQARDKAKTKFLLPTGKDLGPEINAMDREEGLNL